jgi:tRNA dimethylallyltransferase
VGAPDILLLAGPTASGKTALSLHAARRLDGEIVNADSMQVYDGLTILSARPGTDQMGGVPHHLFGHADPGERYSTGLWTQAALAAIADITGRGRRAILVGGTGLYFKALTEGLAPAPDIPAELRERTLRLADEGQAALRAEAEMLDPEAASAIAHGDTQRLIRLIELVTAAGKPLAEIHAATEPLIAPDRWRGVVIQPPREGLYPRIEARFDAMMQAGALDEARAFAERNLDTALPAMKAVGLPPLLSHLRGEITLDEAVALAKRDTRRYAKRQYTWFSNQHPGWDRIETLDPAKACAGLDAIIDRQFS